MRQVLELDEHFWIAHVWLCLACITQGRLAEALAFAEKTHSLVPTQRVVMGLLAGVLVRTGDVKRAQLLQEQFGAADAYGAPAWLCAFHAVLSEFDLAASWFEKAIAQRDTRAPWLLPRMFGDRLISSAQWPALAKMMHLPAAGP